MDALFSQWVFKEESARTSPRAERDDSVAERQLLELTARAKQKRDGHVDLIEGEQYDELSYCFASSTSAYLRRMARTHSHASQPCRVCDARRAS